MTVKRTSMRTEFTITFGGMYNVVPGKICSKPLPFHGNFATLNLLFLLHRVSLCEGMFKQK